MYFATLHHHSPPPSPPPQPESCAQGHSTTLILPTAEGGVICLVCLSNLISNPKSPTVHVSYALSQLSHALSQPQFLNTFITFHSHFLVSPLIHSLSSFNDVPIAEQIVDLVLQICEAASDGEVYGEFVARVSDRLSSGSLAWSRQQLYTLHCMGVLLDNQKNNPVVYIKDKRSLILNLITGLHLSSEEIQAEVLFALYKISLLHDKHKDYSFTNLLVDNCPKLLHLSLEALMKTQNDDVRLNCLAFLTVLAQRGWFQNAFISEVRSKDYFEADNFVQTTEQTTDGPSLNTLFAEAIKGPLLSSDGQVQIATLDLIFLYLSWEGGSGEEIQELVEENIADYVFDILRLSGCKDPLVNSCIQVLDLLAAAEQAFRQRLAIGFTTLLPVVRYVAEVPFHPAQTQSVKLLYNCVSKCPGMVSNSHVEEISLTLTSMLKKHVDGESGILPGTFNWACSTLVALMKCASCGAQNFSTLLRDASRNAVLTCLTSWDKHPEQFLYSLYLLKEAYQYSHDENLRSPFNVELRSAVFDVCKEHLLPWFQIAINSIEDEDIVLGVFETFHYLLFQDSDTETKGFIDTLMASSWFSLLFGCLGLFPSEKMRLRVYLIFSSIVDLLLGNDCGQMLREAALYLPSDPVDLLFLLGQNSSHNSELIYGQSAVLLILYVSSLYDDRLADDKLVLASLEQYILLNGSELLYGASAPLTMELVINLYGLYRGLAKRNYQIPYSPDAERILFHLLDEKGCDLLSSRMHSISLKWLFQQEKICKSLSEQMLKFCRYNNLEGDHIVVHGQACLHIDVSSIAELITSEDNFGSLIFVSLLGGLVEQDDQEHEIISVVNTIAKIIEIFPAASDQLSIHGIAVPIQNLYDHSVYSSFPEIFRATTQLVFIFLRSVQSKSLSNDEAWITIVMKV